MGEISTFGLLVLIVSAGAAFLLAWSQITVRLPVPGAAFFLVGAAVLSNVVPDVGEALSIRAVERITVVALIVILFDGGMNVGWHRFRTSLPSIGLLGLVGTAGTANIRTAAGVVRTGVPLIQGVNPIMCVRVLTGGTATDIWAMY